MIFRMWKKDSQNYVINNESTHWANKRHMIILFYCQINEKKNENSVSIENCILLKIMFKINLRYIFTVKLLQTFNFSIRTHKFILGYQIWMYTTQFSKYSELSLKNWIIFFKLYYKSISVNTFSGLKFIFFPQIHFIYFF